MTHGQSGAASFHRRLMAKVRVRLTILITSTPFVHSQRVGDVYILLEFSPAHADARVTSLAPTNDFREQVSYCYNLMVKYRGSWEGGEER